MEKTPEQIASSSKRAEIQARIVELKQRQQQAAKIRRTDRQQKEKIASLQKHLHRCQQYRQSIAHTWHTTVRPALTHLQADVVQCMSELSPTRVETRRRGGGGDSRQARLYRQFMLCCSLFEQDAARVGAIPASPHTPLVARATDDAVRHAMRETLRMETALRLSWLQCDGVAALS